MDVLISLPFFKCFWFQPALVRYDGLLLLTVGDPNYVSSYRFIKSYLGQGCQCSGVRQAVVPF